MARCSPPLYCCTCRGSRAFVQSKEKYIAAIRSLARVLCCLVCMHCLHSSSIVRYLVDRISYIRCKCPCAPQGQLIIIAERAPECDCIFCCQQSIGWLCGSGYVTYHMSHLRWMVKVPRISFAAEVGRMILSSFKTRQVMTWSAYIPDDFDRADRYVMSGGGTGKTQHAVWDPATGKVSASVVSQTNHDMFCPGIAQLANGDIHVTGAVAVHPPHLLQTAFQNSAQLLCASVQPQYTAHQQHRSILDTLCCTV